jgi:peptidoglycan/LPS O-acetylase OafA/YrhL
MLRIHFLQQWFGLKKTNINITGTLEAGLVILFVLLPVTIRLSSITYLLIEKPFLALRKNYIKKY